MNQDKDLLLCKLQHDKDLLISRLRTISLRLDDALLFSTEVKSIELAALADFIKEIQVLTDENLPL